MLITLLSLQIPLVETDDNYPNSYEDGLQFFTAPEGNIIQRKDLPCGKIIEDLYDLLDESMMKTAIKGVHFVDYIIHNIPCIISIYKYLRNSSYL